jgi:hypothetical protein
MLRFRTLRFALLITALAIVVNMALSDVTFAKQRRGRFNDKKAGKFINGHDARDGRWDGRGPRARFGDRRDRDGRFIFRDRRDRDERFRFRDRWDRDDWRDRRRDDDWRRRAIPHWRRRF